MTIYIAIALLVVSLCAVVFTFTGSDSGPSKKRLAAIRAPAAAGMLDPEGRQRRAVENVRKENAEAKRADLQKRIERAGLSITVKNYWVASGIAGAVTAVASLLFVHS